MRKSFKTSLLMLIVIAIVLAFIPPKHNIVGRWKAYNDDGSIGGYVYLSSNGEYKVTSVDGKKVFHRGLYKFKDDVYSTTDNESCGKNYWARYKFTFVNKDSFNVSVIEDSCTERRQEMTTGNTGLRRSNPK
jgi:hypothetical protein